MFSSSNTQNQILVKCMFWDLPCMRHIHSEGGCEILYRAPLSLLGSFTMLCSCKNNKKKIMMITLRKIAYKIINRSIKFTRLDFWSDINHPVGSVSIWQLQGPRFPDSAYSMWVCPGFSYTSRWTGDFKLLICVNVKSCDGLASHLWCTPSISRLYITPSVPGIDCGSTVMLNWN